MDYFVNLYNYYLKLDPISKFYVTISIGLCVFLYKTFLSMHAEELKQKESINHKNAEILSRFYASIVIYIGGTKDQSEQDKLIEKMGECYPYLNYKTKKKIEMFYTNRSIYTLQSLKEVVKHTLNKHETIGENQLEFEKLFSLLNRLLKPILPLVFLIIVIIIATTNFIQVTEAENKWEKFAIVSDYMSIITSLTIGIGLINLIFQKWKELRNPGLLFWIGTIIIIISPYVILFIQAEYLHYTFAFQILCSIILFVAGNKAR